MVLRARARRLPAYSKCRLVMTTVSWPPLASRTLMFLSCRRVSRSEMPWRVTCATRAPVAVATLPVSQLDIAAVGLRPRLPKPDAG